MEITTSENIDKAPKFEIAKLRYFTINGEKKYHIDKILAHLENREGKGLVRDICALLGEERV
jgi:hypothetical protein